MSKEAVVLSSLFSCTGLPHDINISDKTKTENIFFLVFIVENVLYDYHIQTPSHKSKVEPEIYTIICGLIVYAYYA